MSVTSEDIDPRNLIKGKFLAFRASQWPAWAKKTYQRNWQTSVCWGVLFLDCLFLSKRFLTVQATSAESERSFSLCGQISTKQRANLSGVNLENLAFFKANDQQLQNDYVPAEVLVDNKDDSDPSVVTTSS